MYSYLFEPKAMLEYKDAILWYLERSVIAAENFEVALMNKLSEVCKNPTLYPVRKLQIRECTIKKYPYSILYFIEDQIRTVVVISIFHHNRNPDFKYAIS